LSPGGRGFLKKNSNFICFFRVGVCFCVFVLGGGEWVAVGSGFNNGCKEHAQ